MLNISSLTVAQLERVLAIKKQIEALEQELESLYGNGAVIPAKRGRKKGWSQSKTAEVEPIKETPKKKRKMSAATKAKLSASAKARWAKAGKASTAV
jgi:hypothetical protein